MKKLLILTAISCAFAAQTTTVFADMSSAQRQQIDSARAAVREVIKTKEGCKAMCEELMANKKSKAMLCDMMKNDPQAMKTITGK